MDTVDGTGHKNVLEIYADVRLDFKSAMTYNDELSDVHTMSKPCWRKKRSGCGFYLKLLKRKQNEKRRQRPIETCRMQLALMAANGNLARDISNEEESILVKMVLHISVF